MRAVPVLHRLFVYGSLMRGQAEHRLLGAARALGGCRTAEGFALLDLGEYPALVEGEGSVAGELYEIDDATLARLDEYEDHPTLFERVVIALDDGSTAVTYRGVACVRPDAPRVPDGRWRRESGRDG